VLVRVAVAQIDPLGSFLAWHEAGDHARALEAVAHLGAPLADLQHVRRHLDCLAHVGDSTGYENLLREHAARLGAVPVDVADPAAFLTRARSSMAQVRAPGGTTGAGLVLTERLVVTNRRMVVRGADKPDSLIDPGDLDVLVDGQARTADRIVTSPSFSMVALVQLSEPVEAAPLRLGYTSLIRVGNPVYAVELRADGPPALTSGLVQRFESFSERNLRVLRVDLSAGSQLSDRPLFNAAGEAVAILVGSPNTKDDGTSFALALDGIDELMARAGLDRWQDQP
jgi:molecular chaperone DnaK